MGWAEDRFTDKRFTNFGVIQFQIWSFIYFVILQVAVKVLEKSRIKEKKDVERISREIKILKQLHHPNVVQIYEIIETE